MEKQKKSKKFNDDVNDDKEEEEYGKSESKSSNLTTLPHFVTKFPLKIMEN